MKKISNFIVKYRLWFLGFWIVLTLASIIMYPFVKINYDTTSYLPENTRVKQSLNIMEEEFGLTGQASIMIENVTLEETTRYKKRLKGMDYVKDIIWLDTFFDEETLDELAGLDIPIDPEQIISLTNIPGLNAFYRDDTALLQVIFTQSEHSLEVGKTVDKMREYLETINKPFAMSGTAVSANEVRNLTKSEVATVSMYAVPIVFIILIITTNSWIEPFIFLISVGVSIVVNMGTNIFFPSISFITNSTASLLQLAISMDYSIFLLHAYQKEKAKTEDKNEAMAVAMKKSFSSISASMLTTVSGFAALMFMRYTIGFDLAAVMIKGIILSLIVTFTFLPALILSCDKLINKTKHRSFIPKMGGLSKGIVKIRYLLPAIVLIGVIPAFVGQSKNDFIYGDDSMAVKDNKGATGEKLRIDEKFGKNNIIVVLVPTDEEGTYVAQEKTMIKDLYKEFDNAKEDFDVSILSYNTILDIKTLIPIYDKLPPAIKDILDENLSPDLIEDRLPPELKAQFISEHYSRVLITVDTESESPRAEMAVDIIETVVARQVFSEDAHIIGVSTSVKEIKRIVEVDNVYVNLLSVLFVFVILILNFKGIVTPLVLLFVIELGIWINMAIPYLLGQPLVFFGYMIVSSVQLGATIDYGILFTQFYEEGRKTMKRKDAIRYALDNGGHSILTSSLILTVAGFSLRFVSSVEATSGIGDLIGRGALLSGILVIFLLPALLYIFDKPIEKTSIRKKFYHPPLTDEDKELNKKRDYDKSIFN